MGINKFTLFVGFYFSGEALSIREGIKMPIQGICKRCKYISSQDLCKACVMLDGLNKGLPKLGIGKSSKVKGQLEKLNQGTSSSTCNSQDESNAKAGCCGGKGRGGGGYKSQEDDGELSVSTGKESEVCCSSSMKAGGRRSSNKQRKAKERKNNMKTAESAIADLTEVFTPRDHDQFDADDDFNLDFFGCGGSAEPLGDDDDEVGTMSTRIGRGEDNVDIENLAELASKMVHVGRANKSTNNS
jgi:hypothetical protein